MTGSLRKAFGAALISIWLVPGLARAECLSPGDIVDVPTPGFLKSTTANLFLRAGDEYYATSMISQSSSRLRFLVPAGGTPWGIPFKIVHVETGTSDKVVASGNLCDEPVIAPPSPTPDPDPAPVPSPNPNPDPSPNPDPGSDPANPATSAGPGSGDIFKVLGVRDQKPFRATRNDVVAPSGEPEVILVGRQSEVARALVLLSTAGAAILRNDNLDSLGVGISAVDLRGSLTLDELRALLAQRRIAISADRHSVYGSAGGDSYAKSLVGLPPDAVCRVSGRVRIGIIDGPVDTANPALRDVPILVNSVLNPSDRVGSSDHATGIAALIAGQTTSQTPPGLATGSQLFSVVAFSRNGGREVAKLENIAKALDWMISRKVNVVNMSLAGPENDALEDVIAAADQRGLILVAATGNNRRKQVAYPASDPRVIAITAVDARKRSYNRANSGPEVDFAAPGVDILTPKRRGTAFSSGTSFAAAIATGIIAQELAQRNLTLEQLVELLRKRAEDLGSPGRDDTFGWGLIKATGC